MGFKNDVTGAALKGLEKAGLRFLDLTFREKEVHDGLLVNIKGAIKHPESIPDSRDFGKSLINKSFQTQEVKEVLKQSSIKIVKTDAVKKAGGNLVLDVVQSSEMKKSAGELINYTTTRPQITSQMEKMVGEGAVYMAQHPRFMPILCNLMARALYKEEVFAELINSMVTKNVVSTKWFWNPTQEERAMDNQKVYHQLEEWRVNEIYMLEKTT